MSLQTWSFTLEQDSANNQVTKTLPDFIEWGGIYFPCLTILGTTIENKLQPPCYADVNNSNTRPKFNCVDIKM